MTKKLLIAIVIANALALSCGGDPLEVPGPDFLPASNSTWPDAPDLGTVVSSGIVASDNVPPPPDSSR